MPATPSPLGHRVKTLREEKGWTQQQLAEKAGYQRAQTISNIERGRTLRSTDAYLGGIAAALGTTIEFLRDGPADKALAAVQRPPTGAQSTDEKTVQPALTSNRALDVGSAAADAGSPAAPPEVEATDMPSRNLILAYVDLLAAKRADALQTLAESVHDGTLDAWLTAEAEKRRKLQG